jgi:hypothetical protein
VFFIDYASGAFSIPSIESPGIEEFKHKACAYWIFVEKLLYPIIEKIAEFRKVEDTIIYDLFIKAQFTGDVMHLRDIERIYGPHALEVISLFGSIQDPIGKEINEQVLEYIHMEQVYPPETENRETTIQEARNKRAQEILEKYKNIRSHS